MGKAGQGNSKQCCEAVILSHPVALFCSQVVTKEHHHVLVCVELVYYQISVLAR